MSPNTDFIPFARPSFSAAEEEAVLRILKSGWLTTGPAAAELERRVSEATGLNHAMAVNSATSGLHLALDASGVGAGDYVITSPYTFTSTAEVIRYCGAHPLFVDIEPEGFNISPKLIENALSSPPPDGRIKAVMPVHIGGELCGMEEINSLARRYGIGVIEDGAHLQPGPVKLGSKGILVYSFYATKCITTAEGGMVVTNDDEAARRMKMMRFHGIDREAWDRYRKKGAQSWDYDIMAAGYKYNLPDILAAVGLVQLEKSSMMEARRIEIAAAYDKAFGGLDFLKIPPANSPNSRHLYILGLKPDYLSIDRDQFVNILTEKGIGISVHYKPLHMMSYYSRRYNLKPEDFPQSLERFRTSFSIPIFPALTDEEVSRIINTITETGKRYRRR